MKTLIAFLLLEHVCARQVAVELAADTFLPLTLAPDASFRGLGSNFDWDLYSLEGYPVVGNFSDLLVFKYGYSGTLGDGRVMSISVFQRDCNTTGDDSLVYTPDFSVDGELSVEVDIDEESITKSVFYDEAPDELSATIDFCLRVDYGLTDTNINFHETIVTVNVDLTAGFSLTDVLVKRNGADEENGQISCDVEIYYCYRNHTETFPTPIYTQGGAMEVCIKPIEDQTYCCVTDIQTMDISQDQDGDGDWDARTKPITNFITDPLSFKDCAEGICYVKTQLPSKFFSVPNPRNLTLTGMAVSELCDRAPVNSPLISPGPSEAPSLSLSPAVTPSRNQLPSSMPSQSPSTTSSESPSISLSPSVSPSMGQSLAPSPTYREPSNSPSSFSSQAPSVSSEPSSSPSSAPTMSLSPSRSPSASPSMAPTDFAGYCNSPEDKPFGCQFLGEPGQLLCLKSGITVCRPAYETADGVFVDWPDASEFTPQDVDFCGRCPGELKCPVSDGFCDGPFGSMIMICHINSSPGADNCVAASSYADGIYQTNGHGSSGGHAADFCGCCDGWPPNLDRTDDKGGCSNSGNSGGGTGSINNCCDPCDPERVPCEFMPCCCLSTKRCQQSGAVDNSGYSFQPGISGSALQCSQAQLCANPALNPLRRMM